MTILYKKYDDSSIKKKIYYERSNKKLYLNGDKHNNTFHL